MARYVDSGKRMDIGEREHPHLGVGLAVVDSVAESVAALRHHLPHGTLSGTIGSDNRTHSPRHLYRHGILHCHTSERNPGTDEPYHKILHTVKTKGTEDYFNGLREIPP